MTEQWTLAELVSEVATRIAALPAPKNGQIRAVPDDRTVRYYATLGLLDRPDAMRGRTAIYGRKHLAQIVAIKRMQTMGRSLAEIQALWPTMDDPTLGRMAGVALPITVGRPPARPEFWKREPASGEVAVGAADGGRGSTVAEREAAVGVERGSLEEGSTTGVGRGSTVAERQAATRGSTIAEREAGTGVGRGSTIAERDAAAGATTGVGRGSTVAEGEAATRESTIAKGEAELGTGSTMSEPVGRSSASAERQAAPGVGRGSTLAESESIASSHAPIELRIELAPNVSLVLAVVDEHVSISPADVRAIRAAAAPLIAELAQRRLTTHAGGEP